MKLSGDRHNMFCHSSIWPATFRLSVERSQFLLLFPDACQRKTGYAVAGMHRFPAEEKSPSGIRLDLYFKMLFLVEF
jgi:hypothetical protein